MTCQSKNSNLGHLALETALLNMTRHCLLCLVKTVIFSGGTKNKRRKSYQALMIAELAREYM